MSSMATVPQTYDEWQHCIEVKCGIPLSANYVAERISDLEIKEDFTTKKLIETWGIQHYDRTLGWFREAAVRLAA